MEWKRKSKRIFLCLINIEGEYFNGKTHGKGKEYNEHNELDFDGEFLYSYNFRGKQYANGKLFYESIYNTKILNGKIFDENEIIKLKNGNGKVKDYYRDGTLFFEGEYLNGKRHGICKEYYDNGKVEIEVEYKNGLKNGKVKEYYYNGKVEFEGEYKNGLRNGKGKEFYNDNIGAIKYDGEYLNGLKHGKGCKEYNNYNELIFEGEYSKDKRWNGKGKEYGDSDWNKNELIFEGEYLNGIRKGKEYYLYNGNVKFEGEK